MFVIIYNLNFVIMNRLNLLKSLFLGVFLLCAVCIRLSAQNPKPFVIPELKEWQGKEGSFIPSDKSRIVYGDNSLKQIAEAFASDWKELFGFSMQVTDGKPEAGDFYLTLKNDKKLGKEGYTLSVTKSVTVSAPETTGVYWATRTLLQICEQTEDHRIPEGKVRDWPDYSIRGFMMDCGRKFIPMTYLRDLVKMMSYYKMNVLQVHLNDNGFKQFFGHDWDKTYAAFRLECETFPGLTARDGYYTKQEFVDFQLDAAAQFVEIIPEIDAPAHTNWEVRNMAWTIWICSTRKPILSWMLCSRNTWKAINRFSAVRVYTSVRMNIPTRKKKWWKSSGLLQTGISVM